MSLRYCFETSHVRQTLNRSKKKKKSDLAVIDTEERALAVIDAVRRGMLVQPDSTIDTFPSVILGISTVQHKSVKEE